MKILKFHSKESFINEVMEIWRFFDHLAPSTFVTLKVLLHIYLYQKVSTPYPFLYDIIYLTPIAKHYR